MHRCYFPAEKLTAGQIVTVRGEEAHHALQVMRLKPGKECELFNGRGCAVVAKLLSVRKGEFCAQIVEERPPMPPTAHISLAVAVPKGSLMDLIVQKAVEMGVEHIYPLITHRTIVRLSPDETDAKTKKWRRIALEACKQCGVNLLPAVEAPQSFGAFLQNAGRLPAFRMHCALVPQAYSLRRALERGLGDGVDEACILVGPEGDFTPEENDAARAAGFIPVTLGPRVLRVESAVFFAVAAVRYALDPLPTADYGLPGDY